MFSRNPDNRQKFCERMATLVEAEFVPVDSAARGRCAGADVVICATSSNVPVFDGAWLEPGQHVVTVVGSNSALVKGGWLKEGRRENDDETVRRADFIITNWRESIEQRAPGRHFRSDREGHHHLGQDSRARRDPRPAPSRAAPATSRSRLHANNNGTAAADLAIAQWVYEQCRQMGRGSPIELPRPGEQ